MNFISSAELADFLRRKPSFSRRQVRPEASREPRTAMSISSERICPAIDRGFANTPSLCVHAGPNETHRWSPARHPPKTSGPKESSCRTSFSKPGI